MLAFGILALASLVLLLLFLCTVLVAWFVAVAVFWRNKYPKIQWWIAAFIVGVAILLAFPLWALSPLLALFLVIVTLVIVLGRVLTEKNL